MGELVGSAVGWAVGGAVVLMFGRWLLPGVVKRLRRDPRPSFPPVPLHAPWGRDGATNAALFEDAVRSLVPSLESVSGDEPDEIQITSQQVPQHGAFLSWDDFGPTSEVGTVYVNLPQFEAQFELDMDDDPRYAFWIVVGYLRDGPVHRNGRAWVQVKEVGLWTPFSAAARVTDFEPEWVSDPNT